MPQGRAGAEDVSLLERDRELAAIDGLLSRAVAQDGGLLLVEGPAGIGKTTLLAWARERARRAGLPPLHARGGELEREFPLHVQPRSPSASAMARASFVVICSSSASLALYGGASMMVSPATPSTLPEHG